MNTYSVIMKTGDQPWDIVRIDNLTESIARIKFQQSVEEMKSENGKWVELQSIPKPPKRKVIVIERINI
jgi:C-terminal processing protease CtpA/Prc